MREKLRPKFLCAAIPLLASLLAPAVTSAAASPSAPAAAGPGVPSAAVPSSAPAAPVSSEMRAAIKELLDIVKFRENLTNAYKTLSQNLPQQMAQALNASIQQNPQLTEEQKRLVRERLGKSFDAGAREAVSAFQDPKLIDEILADAYPVFAKYYTLNEIRAINAFYKTPAGAKWIAMLPQVTSDCLGIGMAKVQPRVSAIMNAVLKKELDAVQSAKPAK